MYIHVCIYIHSVQCILYTIVKLWIIFSPYAFNLPNFYNPSEFSCWLTVIRKTFMSCDWMCNMLHHQDYDRIGTFTLTFTLHSLYITFTLYLQIVGASSRSFERHF